MSLLSVQPQLNPATSAPPQKYLTITEHLPALSWRALNRQLGRSCLLQATGNRPSITVKKMCSRLSSPPCLCQLGSHPSIQINFSKVVGTPPFWDYTVKLDDLPLRSWFFHWAKCNYLSLTAWESEAKTQTSRKKKNRSNKNVTRKTLTT